MGLQFTCAYQYLRSCTIVNCNYSIQNFILFLTNVGSGSFEYLLPGLRLLDLATAVANALSMSLSPFGWPGRLGQPRVPVVGPALAAGSQEGAQARAWQNQGKEQQP